MSAASTLFVVLVVTGVGTIAGLRRLMFGPAPKRATRPQSERDVTGGVDGIYHRAEDDRGNGDTGGGIGDADGGDGGGGDGGGGGD